MMAARSASVSCTRLPDSNITSVASIRESSVSRARRAVAFDGRNPSKKNRSVGSAATARAASTDDGPGSAITAWPRAQASRTSLKPGSEISGVPASDTSAMEAPCASLSRIFGRASAALCS